MALRLRQRLSCSGCGELARHPIVDFYGTLFVVCGGCTVIIECEECGAVVTTDGHCPKECF